VQKKILFVGCNTDQLPYLIELKNRGYKIIGTDGNPLAPGAKYCDKFYPVRYDKIDDIVKIGQREGFTPRDRVFTASSQLAHAACAAFAQNIGIQYPTVQSIEKCLDKGKYYKLFADNGVAIPVTSYIKSESDLLRAKPQLRKDCHYYLKSDYSKNPNYIYRFEPDNIPFKQIIWKSDDYFKSQYVLQEEFIGEHVRVNINDDKIYCYHYDINDGFEKNLVDSIRDDIKNKLAFINNLLGISDWLVKYDVIINGNSWVALDIGIDPPFRMQKNFSRRGDNFTTWYLDLYGF
jgi:hypothetical protein